MSATKRYPSGVGGTCGDDIVGCQHRQERHRQRRKRELRRKFRLVGLSCIVLIVGVALLLVQGFLPVRGEVTVATTASTVGGRNASTIPSSGFVPLNGGGGAWGRRLEEANTNISEDNSDNSVEACTKNTYTGGGGKLKVVPLVIAILFTFNGLAIVCDEFFQASLEKISEVLKLTPDVAGATFLAAGSSAPELFTSIADVFGPSNSIGVGTIVGSAMFNVLVIVALSAAIATNCGSSAKVDHRVVARDVTFYTGSIAILIASTEDGIVEWWEAMIMVGGYGLYIVFMIYNSRILGMCAAPQGKVLPTMGALELEEAHVKVNNQRRESAVGEKVKPIPACTGLGGDNVTRRRSSGGHMSVRRRGSGGEEGGDDANEEEHPHILNRRASRSLRVSYRQERRSTMAGKYGEEDSMGEAAAAAVAATSATSAGPARRYSVDRKQSVTVEPGVVVEEESGGNGDMFEDNEDELEWPKGWVESFLFVFGFPFMVGLSLTVPDCSRPQYEKYYIITFIMSISWISLISSYMVELATEAACILGVSAIVMGVLVLAVGTSVPDMIGSMIAAREGEASMAIANAIGSNVFNILLGLGGPWLVSTLIYDEAKQVNSDDATMSLVILFCAVLIFVGSLMLSGWSMNKTLAYSLLTTYFVYVVFTILNEALDLLS